MDPDQTQRRRRVLRVEGADSRTFLQGLVTNDVRRLDAGPLYAALQTAQGKYLADFFLVPDGEDVLIDLPEVYAASVLQKLTMYKLRSKVTISDSGLGVVRGTGTPPEGAIADPRHPDLGWRLYGEGLAETPEEAAEMERLRILLGIPEAGVELIPGDTYILEAGFEALHGVDFKKGCYIGQEIVARMKHKIELRKGLRRVTVSAPVPVGTEIVADGHVAGTLLSQAEGFGIAQLRFDRIGPGMTAAGAQVALADAR